MNDDEVLAVARAALTQVRESLDDVRMEHPVAAVVARARQRQRRRRRLSGATAVGSVLAVCGLLLWTGVLSAATTARTGGSVAQARTVAYVTGQVKHALATENMVFRGDTTSSYGPSVTYAYGGRFRVEEFTGSECGQYKQPSGICTHRGGSERFLAEGTALINGKLTGTYVTYYNRKYSLSALTAPASPCSTTARLAMGATPMSGHRWSAFINASLACGVANVSGVVRINGVETTRITGVPVTVNLPSGEARAVREKQARVEWTLYVDHKTYLPVRISGLTATFGGPAPSTLDSSVTDVQWLPPTAANRALALVTIPTGYRQVSSPADQ
jgi:hypothetical protein